MPKEFRYTEENPYIGKGLNRLVKKGEKYVGVHADLMEFNDLYMRGKNGLDIDEFIGKIDDPHPEYGVLGSCQLSRKNYCEFINGEGIKLVGNTVKSKKMPTYIEKFLTDNLILLLADKGQEFLNKYYDYVDKIYNYQIPLRDIASKGKIKKSLSEYKKDCSTVTKAGAKKSRQAWYELILLEKDYKVDMGDTVYYINTGTKKSDSDVKRITHYYQYKDGAKVEITKELNKEYNKYKKLCKEYIADIKNVDLETRSKYLKQQESSKKFDIRYNKLEVLIDDKSNQYITSDLCKEIFGDEKIISEDEILLNCVLLKNDIVEMEEDVMCNDEVEYNVVKYLEQFNKRITPLLVCFHPNIRNNILITNPKDRKYFTKEETKLDSGHPNNPYDQDTYEQLMTMERKEVNFWLRLGEEPTYAKECGMDWEKIKEEYYKLLEEEKSMEKFKELDEKYNRCLNNLTEEEITKFIEDMEIPHSLSKLVFLDEKSGDMKFHFKEMPKFSPSSGGYLFEDINYDLLTDRLEYVDELKE